MKTRSDLRKLMNGILYVINTGCTWEDVPRNFAKGGNIGYDGYKKVKGVKLAI